MARELTDAKFRVCHPPVQDPILEIPTFLLVSLDLQVVLD